MPMACDKDEREVAPSSMTATEPGVRKDGRCYLCGKTRPEVAAGYHDPFCSTACCRKYYRVLDPFVIGGRVEKGG